MTRYVTGWFPVSGRCEQDPNNDSWCMWHEAFHDEISDAHLRLLTRMDNPHRVRVHKLHLDPKTGCRFKDDVVPEGVEAIEWKWHLICTCGYEGLSWSWWRRYDAEVESGMTVEDWLNEQGIPLNDADLHLDSGALPMALQHVEVMRAQATPSS